MTNIVADRVLDATSSTGTGALTLLAPDVNGYRNIEDVCADGDTIELTVAHRTLPQWETGRYTYGAGLGILTRTQIRASSNAGNAVNFSSGTKDIIAGPTASLLGPLAGVGPFLAEDGTAAAPAYSFASDTDLGLYRRGANNLGIVATTAVDFVNASGETFAQDATVASSGIASYLQRVGNTSGNAPYIAAQGALANIDINFVPKGSGFLTVNSVRIKKTLTNPTYYFSPSGSDANDGLSALTPKLTINTLLTELKSYYRILGTLTFQLANGTYAQSINHSGTIDGIVAPGNFIIQGNRDDRTSVVIQPTGGGCTLELNYGAMLTLRSLTSDHINTSQDHILVGQFAALDFGYLDFKNNANPWNQFSVDLNSSLRIVGDIWVSAGSQCLFYWGQASSLYVNVNNTKSVSKAGTLHASTTVTGIGSTSGLLAGMIVRGTGIVEGTTIASVDSSTQITLSKSATGTGSQTLTIGGMFINYSGSPTVYVGAVYGTLGGTLNLQGIEWTGSFTGRKGILRNGARADFGVSDPNDVPGTLPWYVDGDTGAALKADATATRLEIPQVASGVISGEYTAGQIRFTAFDAGTGGYATSGNALYSVFGTGAHKFYGSDGGALYGGVDSNGIFFGASATSTVAGKGAYLANTGIVDLRLRNTTDSTEINVIAQTPDYTQIASSHRHLVSVGGTFITEVTATAFKGVFNGSTDLGTTTVGFGDLYFAAGKKLNFNNGDVTVTHATDELIIAGADTAFTVKGTTVGTIRATNNATAPDIRMISNVAVGQAGMFSNHPYQIVTNSAVVAQYAAAGDYSFGSGLTKFTVAFSSGNMATAGTMTVTNAGAAALAVGLNGATNPALQVDASTASSATGLKIKSAAAAAGLALSVITSGTNENLTIDAAGSGTITLGGTSTGAIIHTRATTLSAALTYGGVTLSNAVTGTGNMVLSASPTFTGTIAAAAANLSNTLTLANGTLVADNGASATNLILKTRSSGGAIFRNDSNETYFQISPVAASGIVNYMQWVGNSTGANPYVAAQGETNVGFTFLAKGSGTGQFQADTLNFINQAGGTTYLTLTGTTNISSPLSALVLSGTAIPAGGTAGAGYKFSSTSNFGIFFGSGAPTLSAAKGSLYLRSDGSTTNDRAYINTNGSTTWTALTTAA